MSVRRGPCAALRQAASGLLLAAALAPPALAHVGSPDTWFEGSAGPYPVRVVVRAPGVVPGLAEIDVRVLGGHADHVSVQLYGWNVGAHGAPPPDDAKPVPGDPQLWSVSLWFMEPTSYGVHLAVSGREGGGLLVIPVQAVATRRLPMGPGLTTILLGLTLFLFCGWVTIVGAAARESGLPPGAEPGPERIARGRVAMAVAAVGLAAVLYGGRSWWRSVDRAYVAGLYRPLHAVASVADSAGVPWVRLAIDDERLMGRRWTPLIPDHGKLVHLFLLDVPGMQAMAHLHPIMRDSTHFDAALPPLPAGDYQAYADIVHESGFAQTLTAAIALPAGPPTAYKPSDADDAWSAEPPVPVVGAGETSCPLADGSTMTWLGGAELSTSRADARLRFRVAAPGGAPARLEPFLGMAAHAIVRSADGTVFAHLHPTGSVAMASEMALTLRAPGDSVPGTLGRRLTHAGAMDMGMGPELAGDFGIPWGFPKPGRYRVWVQVKRSGAILTGAFDVDVAATAPRGPAARAAGTKDMRALGWLP